MSKNHRKKREKSSRCRSQSVASFIQNSKDDGAASKDEVTYKIKTSKAMGRYMVASKDISAGSIVLSEYPIVVGPCTGCRVQCLGCYKPLEESGPYVKCKKCGWPLCSSTCLGYLQRYGHLEIECEVLKNCKSSKFLDYKDFGAMSENFYAIVPLRCLIIKTTNPTTYEILMTMESHNDIRKNIPDLWNLYKCAIVNKIRVDWGLVEFSEDEIHNICGILDVNAFEIGQQGVNIRGLYPTAFLMSHDCIPNTCHNDEEKDYRLTVRASTRIPTNFPITLSYAYTLQTTLKRRQHLLENKFFECRCRRCSDPTELGTYVGAMRCPKCKIGYVMSSRPLDSEASWCCYNKSDNVLEDQLENKLENKSVNKFENKPEQSLESKSENSVQNISVNVLDNKLKCKLENETQINNKCPGYVVSAKSIKLLMKRISDEADSLDCNDVEGMEKFLEKYRNVLHPSHSLCLGIKLLLSQVYGKINGYLIHELSDELLMRKESICKEIIKIFDVIEPGFSRLRGVTLYELHAPIMILTTRQFERQQLSKRELRHRLKEVVAYLEEANIILQFEPETSPEGMMGVAAKSALLKVKDWGKIIGKM